MEALLHILKSTVILIRSLIRDYSRNICHLSRIWIKRGLSYLVLIRVCLSFPSVSVGPAAAGYLSVSAKVLFCILLSVLEVFWQAENSFSYYLIIFH